MGPGFSPLAEALGLGAGGCSPTLLELGVWLGAKLTFAEAAAFLARCTGTRLSPATLRRATIATGEAVRQLEDRHRTAVAAGAGPVAPAPTELLQVSVDGSMLPVVGGEWREARLAAIGVVRRAPTDPSAVQTTQLSYAATFGSADAFGQEALGEVVRRGVDQAVRVVAVSDGASWIQEFLALHCPQAVRILDFAHAAGYLASAAQASFGPGTVETSEWFARQRHELRYGEPDRVLRALAALPASEDRDTALRYLRERRPMLAYRDFAAAGYPLGSGCVESAHKTVLQARLKRGGMHWHPDVLPAMVALRVTLANQRWDAVWAQIGPHRRRQQHARSAARRQARRPSPLPTPSPVGAEPPPARRPVPARPKLVQHGKPTADHPWRRRLSFFRPATATKI